MNKADFFSSPDFYLTSLQGSRVTAGTCKIHSSSFAHELLRARQIKEQKLRSFWRASKTTADESRSTIFLIRVVSDKGIDRIPTPRIP
jgi:hypothetical protein